MKNCWIYLFRTIAHTWVDSNSIDDDPGSIIRPFCFKTFYFSFHSLPHYIGGAATYFYFSFIANSYSLTFTGTHLLWIVYNYQSRPTIIHFLPIPSLLVPLVCTNGKKGINFLRRFFPAFSWSVFSRLFRVEPLVRILTWSMAILNKILNCTQTTQETEMRNMDFLIFRNEKYGFLDLFSLTALPSGSRNGARP